MVRLPALLRRAFIKTTAQETLPVQSRPDAHQWVQPTAIIRLLAEMAEKKTCWVFASDMQELKDRLARWNVNALQSRQISMLIRSDVNDTLHRMMNDNLHAPAGRHESSDADIQRHVGPHHLDGLRLYVGSTHIECGYIYNIVESYLSFTTNDGTRRDAHFGLDGEFQDGFTRLADMRTEAIEKPCINALPKKVP